MRSPEVRVGALGLQRRPRGRTQPSQDSAEGQKGAGGRGWMEKLALALPAPGVLTTPLFLTKSFAVSPNHSRPPPGEKEESAVTVAFVLVIFKAWTSF